MFEILKSLQPDELVAYEYNRYSSHNQDDGNSIEAQQNAIENFAKHHKIKIIKKYVDRAKSGTNTNREQYQQMMKDLEKGRVKLVLIHKFDRMHRQIQNQINDIFKLKDMGITILSIGEGLDSSNEKDMTMIALRASFAQEYSINLSNETRKGLQVTADMCLHNGGNPPYAFKVGQDHRLEIDETKAKAVRKIFEFYLADMGYTYIQKWLKNNGYKTAKGNDFSKSAINSILKNEKYKGVYTWDKTVAKDSRGKRNSHKYKENYTKIENGCPAIVTAEIFDKVQEKMKSKSDKAKTYNSKNYYPFNSIIFCSCGEKMSGNVQYSGKGKKPVKQYKCSSNCKCDITKSINADYLEESVFYALREVLFSPVNLEKIQKIINEYAEQNYLELNLQIQELLSRKEGLKTAQNNLLNALENGRATHSIYGRLEQIETELQNIENRINSMSVNKHEFAKEDILEIKKLFVPYMRKQKNEFTKKLIDDTIKSIKVSGNKVEINFKEGLKISPETKRFFE